MTYRITLDRKDGGIETRPEAYPDRDAAHLALIGILAASYRTHGGTFPNNADYVGGNTLLAAEPMREVPESSSQRGSGPVTCCGHHRERCLFGRPHTWSTWFEDGRLQRTRTTFHCWACNAVCTAEED